MADGICLEGDNSRLLRRQAASALAPPLSDAGATRLALAASMAGVTLSPKRATGVGTDLFFSNSALRSVSDIKAGSTGGGEAGRRDSNMLRF